MPAPNGQAIRGSCDSCTSVLLWSVNMAKAPRTTVFWSAAYANPKRGCQPLYFGSKYVLRTFGKGQEGLVTTSPLGSVLVGGVGNGTGIRKQAFSNSMASAEYGSARVAGTGQSGFQPDTWLFL